MANKNPNTKGLISNSERTPKERQEQARKAGIASGEARRENKRLKTLLELGLSIQDEETGQENDMAITLALIERAKKGDTVAYAMIRDTLGEKPVEKIENIAPPTIVFDIPKE